MTLDHSNFIFGRSGKCMSVVDLVHPIPVPGGEVRRLAMRFPIILPKEIDELSILAAMTGISADVLGDIDFIDSDKVCAETTALYSRAIVAGIMEPAVLEVVR
jgi:hypothetical protein